MHQEGQVTTSRQDHVLLIGLDRVAKRNAFDIPMLNGLALAYGGLYPFGGATFRFPREVGWGNAMRYLLTGDEFGASEALRIGLVQEVVEPGQQVTRALELAQVVAAQAPLGVRATLASARLSIADSEEVAKQRLVPDMQPIIQSEDLKEGVQSFIERRQANFKGK